MSINYREDIEKVRQQIAEKDRGLADLFNDLIKRIIDQKRREIIIDKEGDIRSNPIKITIDDIVNSNRGSGNMNIIPGEFGAACFEDCVCFAFDKWQSSKGFHGIAKKVIEYWLACSKINRRTLIISNAWDDIDFFDKYKRSFDKYAQDPTHKIAIVLVSSMGISLQYLQ